MTAPRQVLPGTTYLYTRRCSERRFFLTPSRTVNDIVLYALAIGAQRFGILIHAVCVMSSHIHLVLTDPLGRLPEFAHFVNPLIANAVNRVLGRDGALWEAGSYSAVELVTPADALREAAYVLANPVAAGLVAHGSEWPGVWSTPDAIGGRALTVRRPHVFFDAAGSLPDTAALTLTPPPGFATATAFREQLSNELAARELEAAAQLASAGRSWVGAKRIVSQEPHERARSEERRRDRRPVIACCDATLRRATSRRLAAFMDAYRRARDAFVSGVRDALFPPGTYWLRVYAGVRCEDAVPLLA